MKICYLDAFSGISGDMTAGALLDAGASQESVLGALASLQLGASFRVERAKRRGMAAAKFHVDGGEQKSHRHLPHILKLIERAEMSDRARSRAALVFQKLGEAEARVHEVPLEKVHFHEVGAVDSICDIVAVCAALEALGVEELYCSAVNLGSGTVNTEHGVLPVPAPATADLLRGKPVYARGPAVELTTPTGAAIVSALAVSFGAMPPMEIQSTGYGAGDRDFPEHANILRAMTGQTSGATEATAVSVLEANIDDASPQLLGYAMERLLEAGALDVALQPVFMKKNRPGILLSVIAAPERKTELAGILFAETSTLGIRTYTAERLVQARTVVEVATPHGTVRIKIGANRAFAPEYEDCRRLARERGVPLKQVLADASAAYLNNPR